MSNAPVLCRRSNDPVLAAAWRAAGVLLLVLACAAAADAQILYGSITGTVIDAQDAVLPGATVTATQVDTGVRREAVTDGNGIYLFNDLRPGVYRVSIALPGFRPVAVENVRVDSNVVRRADARLEVSAVQEAVLVTAAATLLETERASLHVTQTAREINDLPLTGSAGRNYQSLMQVVPGSVMAG